MNERAHLSIGEVLSLLQDEFPDVSISKIRFLESQGLIEPQRTPSGYRQFYPEDTARLRWILMEQRDNFLPLKIIKERLSGGEFDRWYADGAVVPGSGSENQPSLFETPAVQLFDDVDERDDDDDGESAVIDTAEIAAELEVADDGDDLIADAEIHSLAEAARRRSGIDDVESDADTERGSDPQAPGVAEPPTQPRPEGHVDDDPGDVDDSQAVVDDDPGDVDDSQAVVDDETDHEGDDGESGDGAAPSGAAAEQVDDPVEETTEDPLAHDVMLAAARQAASRVSPPRRPDPVPPPPPASVPPVAAPAMVEGPLDAGQTSVSLTVEELSRSTGLTPAQLGDLERYGLLHSRAVGPAVYYDGDAMVVAKLAAAFFRHGVEARHLRMYKTAAEREAGVFEQVVAPLVRRSDATSRREARERLVEMARLGEALHAALLRLTLKAYTDPR